MLQRIILKQPKKVLKRYTTTPRPTNTNTTPPPIPNSSSTEQQQQQQAQQMIKDFGINSAKFAAFGLKKRYDEDIDQHRTVPVTPEVIKLGYSMAWKALLWASLINIAAAVLAIYYVIVVWECKSVEDVRSRLKQVMNSIGLETLSDREEYNEHQMEEMTRQDPSRREKVDKVLHFFKSIHITEKQEEEGKDA